MKKQTKKAKSIFFATLGCRLNQAETEGLKLQAMECGLGLAASEESANILVLNSCSVTDKAQKYTDKILKKLNDQYPQKELIITGCGARSEHKKYAKVIPNTKKHEIFDCAKATNPRKQVEATGRTRLMVKVQDGCNNFCAYCTVPYLRGREVSKSLEVITKELQEAEKRGYKEVVLCGVNIGKYRYQGKKLADLIREILENTQISRIRLSSINPDDFGDDLIALWVKNKRLCPHFHISLQSGSETVLERMGRKYSPKQYSGLVTKLRKSIPDVQITTDIIVGFPGETEAEFSETMKFIQKTQFLKVHVFRYSPREGTRAAKMSDQVSEKAKKERAVKLQKLDSKIRGEILQNYINKETEVLFEQEQDGFYSGFTMNYVRVLKRSKKDLSNRVVRVLVMGADKDALLTK